MKVVILAGGLGSRLSEETVTKPKPMVQIGNKPILWHIMKIYSFYGFNDFVILCGYKGHMIKEYFANYFYYNNDIEISLNNNEVKILNNVSIGSNSTVLPVCICENVVIGAGSVVTKDITKPGKYIGNPAKKI